VSRVEDDEQDLTRKERREQARAQRKDLEESERLAAQRRRRLIQVGGAVLVAVVIAVVAILASSGGGKKHEAAATGSGATAGLQSTPAPWPPEHSALQTRVAALHLPPQSDTAYHVHADLRVYVSGHQVPVPAQIGINPQEEFLAPLHTHDTSGIIHMEASEQYPFTLGQFFTVWGVTFTRTQLGSYVAGKGNVLAVYVNGSPVTNFVEYVMRPHDDIVVAYGKPGSFPTSFQYPWASNPGL
jgi:hypothetical protein